MKAMSAVLPQVQRPFTVLGLPAPLAVIALLAAAAAGTVTVPATRSAALFLPVGITVLLTLWIKLWRKCRTDHHYDRTLLNAARFWRGKPARTLIAGQRP